MHLFISNFFIVGMFSLQFQPHCCFAWCYCFYFCIPSKYVVQPYLANGFVFVPFQFLFFRIKFGDQLELVAGIKLKCIVPGQSRYCNYCNQNFLQLWRMHSSRNIGPSLERGVLLKMRRRNYCYFYSSCLCRINGCTEKVVDPAN